jgi:hypothetical protein
MVERSRRPLPANEVHMIVRDMIIRRAGTSFAFLMLAFGSAGGCARGTAPESIAEAVTTPPPGDPRWQPECSNAGNFEVHNDTWPQHEAGACPAVDEYTFDQAVASCASDVKYFGYECDDLSDGNHTWTVYYGCCAPVCPAGSVESNGFCWVVNMGERTASATCARVGLTGSDGFVTGLIWTPAILADVSAKLGCIDAGDTGCCAQSMWLETSTNTCFTDNFSADVGGEPFFNWAGQRLPGQFAVDACNLP